MADTSVKQQIIDKLKDSNNVLVTVSSNPSVDELSAALGITLLLNKLNKHATAVFSGAIPSAIEFLEPHKTFENTVDSLRDFIIALDKEKADHLRYKVVDDMVKIFITPYRTTISEKDLDFSQGDYNVEVVLAIGVKTEADLDKALESHGRILHDATVAAISLGEPTNLGGMEWTDKSASSYSEMLVELAEGLKTDKNLVDEQIATAFLTGIVAATERFSNDKTSSKVMTAAAQLMAAGANQQLIATKLQEGSALPATQSSNGSLKEGEATKVDRSSSSKETSEDAGASGGLAISHVPEGTIEEVEKEIAEQKSEAATSHAEAELQRATAEVAATQQAEAAAAAEKELAANLAATTAQQPPTLRGPVAMDQWRQSPAQPMEEPMMGGTLNATTEQAAVEKQQEKANDRNRTILSHGGSGYVTGEPSYQAPINAVNSPDIAEPSVPDILAAGHQAAPTAYAAAIEPPAPVAAAPTLAEIDAQNRAHQQSAMDDITAALSAPSAASAAEPVPAVDAVSPVPTGALPPLPPMPDFSTLPPLPAAAEAATLGATLPPLGPIGSEPAAVGSGPADPAQFRIPGQ